MSFEADEEILQDFLVEAGEILESMSEQLVALENNPEDMDLLNGIFRGFHTVKGGAGFLSLTPLVEICHITENIFDILRNGQRTADANLMDHILQALDMVNDMFDAVRGGDYPESAAPEFLAKLQTFVTGTDEETDSDPAANAGQPEQEISSEADASDDISDSEFDDLLSELNQNGNGAGKSSTEAESVSKEPASSEIVAASSDEITDDEFEKLLDELHGSGTFTAADSDDKIKPKEKAKPEPDKKAAASAVSPSDDISDDEFEALLDELHGKGGTVSTAKESSPAPKKPASAGDSEAIDDNEFEALLDELHGEGQGPVNKDSSTKGKEQKSASVASSPVSKPSASSATDKTPAKKPESKPAVEKKAAKNIHFWSLVNFIKVDLMGYLSWRKTSR